MSILHILVKNAHFLRTKKKSAQRLHMIYPFILTFSGGCQEMKKLHMRNKFHLEMMKFPETPSK